MTSGRPKKNIDKIRKILALPTKTWSDSVFLLDLKNHRSPQNFPKKPINSCPNMKNMPTLFKDIKALVGLKKNDNTTIFYKYGCGPMVTITPGPFFKSKSWPDVTSRC